MLGLGLQINKMVNRAGGLPPLASLLTFFSKQRDDTTVINKLDSSGDSDAYLTVDPAVDIIDLSKYDIEDGTGDDLDWKVVKFNTINGEETYRVISTPTTYIENGSTYNGLNEVRNGLSDKYIMSEDIDLDVAPYSTGEGWYPIGTLSSPFTGKFNGNGFKISNLFIDRTTNTIGLFGLADGAKVSNISVVDCDVTGNENVGGLVGYNTGSSTITNSYSTGSVIGNVKRVGGLVGYNTGSSTITNSYSACNVTGNDFVGSLIGYNYGGIVNNSYSIGSVIGEDYVGGLIGYNYNSTVNNSYSTGNVTGNTNLVGGLVGSNHYTSTITNSYFDKDESTIIIDGVESEGNYPETGRTTEQLQNIDDIETDLLISEIWDFTNIWNIDSSINNGYPYLRNLEGEYVSPYGTLTKIVTVNIVETDTDDPHSYVKMPSDIKIGGLSLFNRNDTTIYNTTCTTAEEYVSEDPYLWHVDELNTETILSYLKDAYKFTWFVKNTFTEGTYEPLTIKEIFAYSQKIEDADDLSKIMKYLGINIWYDSQIWDNDAEWID